MELHEAIEILTAAGVTKLKREYAQQELHKIWMRRETFTAEQQLAALAAAASGPPVSDDDAEKLVEIVAFNPDVATVQFVESHFFQYPKGAQRWALELLCRCDEIDGAVVFMRLLRECQERTVGIEFPQYIQPRHLEVYLPSLLELADRHDDLRDGVVKFVSVIPLEDFPDGTEEHVSRFLNSNLRRLLDLNVSLQQRLGPQFCRSDDTFANRNSVTTILVALERLPSMISHELFVEGLKSSDPMMKHNFLVAHLVVGLSVDQADIESVASKPETRMYIYAELRGRELLSRMPRQYATNAALSESQMVDWLSFPTELGYPPEEIQLMGTFSGDAVGEDDSIEYFVYRFRADNSEGIYESEWMAGICGPFHRTAIERNDGSETFSSFTPWNNMTAEEHLKAVLGKH